MKNKNGFTLIELLAVIAILALLVIIAMPNILKIFNNARKNTFVTEARTIFKEAESQYIKEQFKGNKISRISSTSEKTSLDLNGKKLDYCVILDNNGKVTKLAAGNDNYHILLDNVDHIEDLDINKVENGELSDVICNQNIFKKRKKCLFDGDLKPGAEYVDGQYTYRYKQQLHLSGTWISLSKDGWGVTLTDKESTDPVTSEICTKINDKPVLSMAYAFKGSKASSINLETFDTSKITNMSGMFYDCSNLTNLDLTNFDTSNVTDMSGMFRFCSGLTSLDLSSFNTSKVTNFGQGYRGMFAECTSLANLDISNFDTSNAKYMDCMFSGTNLTSLDLSNFDTSNVEDMSRMFYASKKLKSINLSSFNTSKVKTMRQMFSGCTSLSNLDMSNFDTSSVTDMGSMFYSCYKLKNINLGNFNTPNLTDTNGMFRYVTGTVIDMRNADLSNITSNEEMFSSTTNTIYLKDTPENRAFMATNFDGYTPIYVN